WGGGQADRGGDPIGNGGRIVGQPGHAPRDLGDLRQRDVERVLVVDARRAADDLGDGPERDAVPIRQAATAEDLAALPRRSPDRELADEPGLPDAGLADNVEEL